MATRLVLPELAKTYRDLTGQQVVFESVGGLDAAKRIESGEVFDLVVLATDLIDRLIAAGKALRDSRQDLFRSPVAIAVRMGAPRPDTGTGDALRAAILAARSIGYSTGPSGVELLKLFERWGIAGAVKNRAIQAPPGIPVGQMLAEGSVELGFQQLSEMMYVPGIELLGTMPQDCAIVSIFTAAQCCGSLQPDAVRDLIGFMHAHEPTDLKRRYGLEQA